MTSKGRIVDIKKESSSTVCGGIRGHQGYERTPYGFYNGYGGFSSYPTPELNVYVYVYETENTHLVDIRELVKEETGVSRITRQMVEELRDLNVGRKVWLETDWNGDWVICDDELIMP